MQPGSILKCSHTFYEGNNRFLLALKNHMQTIPKWTQMVYLNSSSLFCLQSVQAKVALALDSWFRLATMSMNAFRHELCNLIFFIEADGKL